MRWLATSVALVPLAALAIAIPATTAGAGDEMARAARAWLESLTPELRAEAAFAFDDAERERWHFVPGDYPGVSFAQMGLEPRRRAHALLRAALSSAGYHKTAAVMRLDQVLRELAEARGQRADHRDPERYSLAVFGEPGPAQPWGWRLQGHHVSLNFSAITGEITAVTPAFLGANPAEVRDGPLAGLRVLGREEDLARELLGALDEAQRGQAMLAAEAPRDVILGPDREAGLLGEPKGVAFADLTEPQRALLLALLGEFAHNLRAELAAAELARIDQAGLGRVRFAWAGSANRGEPHYWRLHGPTFAIEYDNTQDDANHVHTVWHDLTNDFGRDALRAHLEAQHRDE